MPILTGVPLQPTRPTLIPNTLPDRRAATWTWQSPGGEEVTLTGVRGVFVEPGGIVGHLLPPVALYSSENPGVDGGANRGQKWRPRDLGVRLTVAADTTSEWRELQERLPRLFDTSTGEGVLTCTQPDGSARSIRCVYESGLEGTDPGAMFYAVYPILLKAYDPWWFGGAYGATLRGGVAAPFFPGFPFVFAADGFTDGLRVPPVGHQTMWPTWTFTGPCSGVTVTRSDTGASFSLSQELGRGDQVVVRTDPREPSWRRITDGGGVNVWGIVAGDFPDLFGFPPTGCHVQVTVDGATEDSAVQVQASPRYRSA